MSMAYPLPGVDGLVGPCLSKPFWKKSQNKQFVFLNLAQIVVQCVDRLRPYGGQESGGGGGSVTSVPIGCLAHQSHPSFYARICRQHRNFPSMTSSFLRWVKDIQAFNYLTEFHVYELSSGIIDG